MTKRILMISGDRALARGDKGAFYSTLSELRQYFNQIDIICPPVVGSESGIKIFENVFVYTSRLSLLFQPIWILWQGYKLNKMNKYDSFVVHEYPPFYNGIGAFLLKFFTGLNYILEIHHIPGYPKYANSKERLYKFLTKYFIGIDTTFASKVRVVNKQETPQFLIKAGVNRKKLVYCPSFYINYDIFKFYPEVEKKYDFVFAARLESNKGILNLIEAFKLLLKSRPNLKLLIIGKGSLSDELRNKVLSEKLASNIVFSGWLATAEDVARAYCSARIFINPSFNEGGPRVLLEAMACGLPVISTPVGIAKDVIIENKNGWFIDWDPTHMMQIMLKAISSNINISPLQMPDFEYKNAISNYADTISSLKK